jgi:hypothetical protein
MVAALNILNITFPAGITGLSLLPGNGDMPKNTLSLMVAN